MSTDADDSTDAQTDRERDPVGRVDVGELLVLLAVKPEPAQHPEWLTEYFGASEGEIEATLNTLAKGTEPDELMMVPEPLVNRSKVGGEWVYWLTDEGKQEAWRQYPAPYIADEVVGPA